MYYDGNCVPYTMAGRQNWVKIRLFRGVMLLHFYFGLILDFYFMMSEHK